jgi:hypothetical protein
MLGVNKSKQEEYFVACGRLFDKIEQSNKVIMQIKDRFQVPHDVICPILESIRDRIKEMLQLDNVLIRMNIDITDIGLSIQKSKWKEAIRYNKSLDPIFTTAFRLRAIYELNQEANLLIITLKEKVKEANDIYLKDKENHDKKKSAFKKKIISKSESYLPTINKLLVIDQEPGSSVSLEVTDFLKFIPTGYSIYENINLIQGNISNPTHNTQEVIVYAEIKSYSERWSIDKIVLSPNSKIQLPSIPCPVFKKENVKNLTEITMAQLNIEVVLVSSNQVSDHKNFKVWLHAPNVFVMAINEDGKWQDLSKYICAWVTPNAQKIQELFPKLTGVDDKKIQEKVRKIYEVLKNENITYVPNIRNIGARSNEISQTVYLPREILEKKIANCTEATVLMASLMERLNIDPVIVLIQKPSPHTFIGWKKDNTIGWKKENTIIENKNPSDIAALYDFLEATDFTKKDGNGNCTFDNAMNKGRRIFDMNMDKFSLPISDNCVARIVDVKYHRKQGVFPLE